MTQWRVLCPHNHLLKTATTTGDIRELSSYYCSSLGLSAFVHLVETVQKAWQQRLRGHWDVQLSTWSSAAVPARLLPTTLWCRVTASSPICWSTTAEWGVHLPGGLSLWLAWLIDWVGFNVPLNTYRGRVFTSQMTQPTVSKHWRK